MIAAQLILMRLSQQGDPRQHRPAVIGPDHRSIDSEKGIVLGGSGLEGIQQRADFARIIRIVRARKWRRLVAGIVTAEVDRAIGADLQQRADRQVKQGLPASPGP